MGRIGDAGALLFDADLTIEIAIMRENSAIIISICRTRRRFSSS